MGESPKNQLCARSIAILRERCLAWFVQNGIPGPWYFPDHDDAIRSDRPSADANVVLFGSVLERILESDTWKPRLCRFWVLSQASRDVLHQLLGIPRAAIGLIPRYELYPAAPASAQRNFPAKDEPFELVFAGRLSPTKNIEMLLKTVSFLQTEQDLEVGLSLFGPFDNADHGDREPPVEGEAFDYRARVLRCIEQCAWTRAPQLRHELGPDEWIPEAPPNPVFTSFSTYICEDFGVALAQAQAQGWPSLLTDWGAHRDVRGPGIRRIPAAAMGIHENDELVTLKARNLAQRIAAQLARGGGLTFREISPGPAAPERPSTLEAAALEPLRTALVHQLGLQGPTARGDAIFRATGTPPGDIFFSRYRELFSGTEGTPECVVLVTGFNPTENPLIRHVPEACRLLTDQAMAAGSSVQFAYVKEIFHLNAVSQLLNAGRVILPFFSEELLPLARFLQASLPAQVPLTVLAPVVDTDAGARALEALRQLRLTRRTRDRIHEFHSEDELAVRIGEEFARASGDRVKEKDLWLAPLSP